MKNIKKFLAFFPLFCGFFFTFGSMQAQNYYIELKKDPSGINTAPYLLDLNAKAGEVCALFDTPLPPG